MQMGKLVWMFSCVAGILALPVFPEEAQKPAVQEQKIFSITINPPADADFTEIEFADINLATATDAEKISGARVKVVRTKEKVFREYLAPDIRYFRVRSVHKTGVAGPFSAAQPVSKYLRKAYREPAIPVVQQGKTEYLLGSRIELPVQPNLVTKYRIGEGEFIEYKEPLVFEKPDTYKMEVQLENAEKQVVYRKNFVFKVELNPPKTRAVIVNPVQTRRGISVGKESSLVFLVDDAESGLAKTFFRIVPLGKDAGSIAFMEYGNRLQYNDLQTAGETSLLQYYSVDKAGNKEEMRSEMIFCDK